MLAVLGLFVAIYIAVSFFQWLVLYILARRFAHFSKRRLMVYGACVVPMLWIILLVLSGIGLFVTDDPSSLDDAPQRSFFMMIFISPVILLMFVPSGLVAGWWVAKRRMNVASNLRDTFV